ncbi:MAG: hypothetical protein A3C55_05765 [Gammaproteobacteria bacterium RIFCSPHIGHO2_02_FULL_42_13]|nr:MAG: hypothetical protein A3C55_05765 [Gammaproteobacteria bacterium RIFCSPHIGHO2_02_FULL_42_13]OGT69421.1 MAG: hypothetical protein A3H43_05400 [Gammaproteobacteria bacterium RIFCSPLOWO2_02_FULL_42_9]
MPKKHQTREEMEKAVAELQEEHMKMDIEFARLYGRAPSTDLPPQRSFHTHRLTRDEIEATIGSMQSERQRQDEESLRLDAERLRLDAERLRLIRERKRIEQDSHQLWGVFYGFFGRKVPSSTPSRDADSTSKLQKSATYKPAS